MLIIYVINVIGWKMGEKRYKFQVTKSLTWPTCIINAESVEGYQDNKYIKKC